MSALISSPDELLKVLLKNRSLTTKASVEQFFNPKLSDFEEDLNLSGVKNAKTRIMKAIEDKETIFIYGDYDVDGLSSTAIMYHALTTLGAKVLPYIPHREKEGYGLSKIGIDSIKEKNGRLIITVDNGIVAIEQAKYIKKLGVDLIITDHHVPSSKLPEAISIVHSTTLCGAGVAWCLAKELVSIEEAEELLQFVALGTICDMMPLTGVNRALVQLGIKELRTTNRVGILALLQECEISAGEVTSYDISHYIGPKLNSVGRLDSAMDGLRLLCTKDPLKARQLAAKLVSSNEAKKQLTVDGILKAREILTLNGTDAKKVLILHSPDWIPGIIGLMAGRICEEYKVPAVVISEGSLQSKGSARSFNGLDIVATIRKCSDILLDVGGHPKAAGFAIETKKIPEFKEMLEKLINQTKVEEAKIEDTEALVDVKKINKSWVDEIEKLEPFGVGNPNPVLSGRAVRVGGLRTVGEGKHLKFTVEGIEAIGFSLGSMKPLLKEGQLVNLNFYLEINHFNGKSTVQLKVLDIAI